MPESMGIYKIHLDSFKADMYTSDPFRMIGLIDVDIRYSDGIERVTLPFFRSSGTNGGKIRGLWYPIVGIKLHTGGFNEFTPTINFILTAVTRNGRAKSGWLAKSLFFGSENIRWGRIRGFSSGSHYDGLLWVGETLRNLYESEHVQYKDLSDIRIYNNIITSKEVYEGNKYSQRDNFDTFINEIYLNY